jgi:hypothetical protein
MFHCEKCALPKTPEDLPTRKQVEILWKVGKNGIGQRGI